jgi:hypothetical protein
MQTEDNFDWDRISIKNENTQEEGKLPSFSFALFCIIILYFFEVAIYPIMFFLIYSAFYYKMAEFTVCEDKDRELSINIDILLKENNQLKRELADLRCQISAMKYD